MCVSRGWGQRVCIPPGRSQVVICSLEILLLTTSRRSRTPRDQLLRTGGQVRTALCEKNKITFSADQPPPPPDRIFRILPCSVNIQTLLSASSTVAVYPRHQYVFFETPNGSMWWIDGVGEAQRILKGLNMN